MNPLIYIVHTGIRCTFSSHFHSIYLIIWEPTLHKLNASQGLYVKAKWICKPHLKGALGAAITTNHLPHTPPWPEHWQGIWQACLCITRVSCRVFSLPSSFFWINQHKRNGWMGANKENGRRRCVQTDRGKQVVLLFLSLDVVVGVVASLCFLNVMTRGMDGWKMLRRA